MSQHNLFKTRWYSNEAKISELRLLLEHPVLQEALQLAASEGRPVMVGRELAPSERLNALAVEHARAAGWHSALDYLFELATPKAEAAAAPTKSWSHLPKSRQ